MPRIISGLIFALAVLAALFSNAAVPRAADNRQVGVVPSVSQVPNADKNFLVAVGINRYDDERVNALQFCKADAEAIHSYFTRSGVAPESGAYLLVSESADPKFTPTRLNILESVQYAARMAGPDSTILLFFAGHGFVDTDGKSYLLPQDGKISLLRDTAVSIDRINEILRESPCKRKVVFMDACRNAPTRGGRGAMDEKRTAMFLEALKASAGQVTLAACNQGESSFEDTESGHGVFTLHVLRGLSGAAQADPNGLINVTTLQHYLSEKVPIWAAKRRKPVQHPWMWGEMSAPIPLAVPGRGPILVPLVDSGQTGAATPTPPLPGTSLPSPSGGPGVTPRPVSLPSYSNVGLEQIVSATAAIVAIVATLWLLRRRRKRNAVAPRTPDGSDVAVLFPATPIPYPGSPLPEAMRRARLVCEGPEVGRKILLLVGRHLAVGVSKFTKDPRVDLTLRFLPCRSKDRDPENWMRNKLISSPHFTIEAQDGRFAIRDEDQSKNGTSLIELLGGEDDTSLSVGDTETVFETPSMMEEMAQIVIPRGSAREGKTTPLPKGVWTPLDERCAISLGGRLMVLHAQTFASKKLGLYALRLKRTDNFPSLEYVQLIRRAYIGSDPKCAVRVPDPSFPRLAAAIDYKKGAFFLVTGETGARVLLNHEEIPKSRMVALTHVSLIEIGDYRWRFEPATIEDFTETD